MSIDDTSIIEQCNMDVFKDEDMSAWDGSRYTAFKQCTNGKRRGTWGERYFARVMSSLGCDVSVSHVPDYDVIVNSINIEIKTCCSDHNGGRHLTINFPQIRPAQSYDILIGQVVTPQEIRCFAIDKGIIQELIDDDMIINQHGGHDAHSGAYILKKNNMPDWLCKCETTYEKLAKQFKHERKAQ